MPLRRISVVAVLAIDATTTVMTTNDRTGSFIYRDGAGKEAVGS